MESSTSDHLPGAPRISVLVAVYKTPPEVLRETIRSVLEQTIGDFELLLLDDCPADPRESVVREFSDSRIRYSQNAANLGISPTRNRLMEMARGTYFAILDHDDVCRCDRLEKEATWLDAHAECGVVSSYTRHIPGGRVVGRPSSDRELLARMTAGNPLAHSAMMLRASVLKENGIRYEAKYSPAEDYRILSRLMELSSFHCIPEPLLEYREHDANTTGCQYGRMLRMATKIRNDIRVRHPELVRQFDLTFGPYDPDRCPLPTWFRILEAFRMGWMRLVRGT